MKRLTSDALVNTDGGQCCVSRALETVKYMFYTIIQRHSNPIRVIHAMRNIVCLKKDCYKSTVRRKTSKLRYNDIYEWKSDKASYTKHVR